MTGLIRSHQRLSKRNVTAIAVVFLPVSVHGLLQAMKNQTYSISLNPLITHLARQMKLSFATMRKLGLYIFIGKV